jgi:hypothetical protein
VSEGSCLCAGDTRCKHQPCTACCLLLGADIVSALLFCMSVCQFSDEDATSSTRLVCPACC